jgi:hypothetical protein
MRGQLYFREQDVTKDGASVVGGVGLLEVPRGSFAENVVRGLVMSGGAEAFAWSLTDYSVDMNGEDYDWTWAAEIDNVAMQPVWPLPGGRALGGGMMVRRTHMPAPEGMEVVICVAVVKAPPQLLRRDVMYAVAGQAVSRQGCDPRSMPSAAHLFGSQPKSVPTLVARGNQLHQLLKQPVWGFGTEGVAFTSTMSRELIDQCDVELEALGNPAAAQAERLAFLRAGDAGGVLAIGKRNGQFALFREKMEERFGRRRFAGVRTATEVAEQEAAASQIIAEILEAREEPLAGPSLR